MTALCQESFGIGKDFAQHALSPFRHKPEPALRESSVGCGSHLLRRLSRLKSELEGETYTDQERIS
jgi:hypothetical protein